MVLRSAAAAADENEDEDDPQAAIAAPTVVPTHKLEPPVRDGDRPAVSVHLMPQEGRCAPEAGLFFRLGLVAPDEQGGLAAEVLQVGHGRRRELQGPAAAGAEQLHGAVIDLQLPVLAAAGAGDAPPAGRCPAARPKRLP